MNLKTATLIALIFSTISVIFSLYSNISYWATFEYWEKGYIASYDIVSSSLYIIKDLALTIFFYVLYRNQN